MKKTLVIAALAAGIGLCSVPTFAKGYVVNGHAASAAEEQFLASHGFEPGAWIVDGGGIGPADTNYKSNVQPAADSDAKRCWYIPVHVQLCDH